MLEYRHHLGRYSVGGILMVLATSCGMVAASPTGGDAGANNQPPTGSVAEADFAHTFATTYCRSIAACCGRFAIPFDLASCTATLEPSITTANTAPPQGTVYDPVGAAACIDAYAAVLTACTNDTSPKDPCGAIFRGAVPTGGACVEADYTVYHQCAPVAGQIALCWGGACTVRTDPTNSPHARSGQHCYGDCFSSATSAPSCPLPATLPATADGGIPVEPPGERCWREDGLYCVGGYCTPLPAAGATCLYGACASPAICINQLCVAPHSTGTCILSRECAEGTYCDPSSQTCTPQKPDGATCAGTTECVGKACSGTCSTWTVATPGTCSGHLP